MIPTTTPTQSAPPAATAAGPPVSATPAPVPLHAGGSGAGLIPGALATTRTITALSLTRLARGRALWVGAMIGLVPIAFAAVLRAYARSEPHLLDVVLVSSQLLLVVLPAMFVATSIGEDIEDRTTTYLWSRPVPRTAVLAGKLVALVPVVALVVAVSWLAAAWAVGHEPPPAISVVAVAGGATAVSLIAAAVATLVPRHGMALTIVYMLLFDVPIGLLPVSLRQLSATHHVRAIADLSGSSVDAPAAAALGLAVIGAVWLVVGLWRIRRLEA